MKKPELVAVLQDAVRSEETATRVYLSHLQAITTRLDLPADRLRQIGNIMEGLIKDNRRHRGVCRSMLARIQEHPGDDI